MTLPRKLKNFHVFIDGTGLLGLAMEVTPPTLEVSTEPHRGSGMDAPVEIDMGMEPMTAEMTFSEYSPDVMRFWGDSAAPIPMTLRGAAQSDSQAQAVLMRMRGYFKKVDPGTWKPGESVDTKLEATLRYYAFELDGVLQTEVDVDNMIRFVNGRDLLADQRRALGSDVASTRPAPRPGRPGRARGHKVQPADHARARVRDDLAVQKRVPAGDPAYEAELFAHLCEVPRGVIEEMTLPDYERLQGEYGSFSDRRR